MEGTNQDPKNLEEYIKYQKEYLKLVDHFTEEKLRE